MVYDKSAYLSKLLRWGEHVLDYFPILGPVQGRWGAPSSVEKTSPQPFRRGRSRSFLWGWPKRWISLKSPYFRQLDLEFLPFSHYDLEKPEFEREHKDTIKAIEKLKAVDPKMLGKETIDEVKKNLNAKIISKDKLIHDLGNKLKKK